MSDGSTATQASQDTSCCYCGEQLGGMMMGTGEGWSCEKCWYERHPFEPLPTFDAVLANNEDQVIVRELLRRHVSPEAKRTVRDQFNEMMQRRYAQRCRDLGIVLDDPH